MHQYFDKEFKEKLETLESSYRLQLASIEDIITSRKDDLSCLEDYEPWVDSGSPEWKLAIKKRDEVKAELEKKKNEMCEEYGKKRIAPFEGDQDKVFEDAKVLAMETLNYMCVQYKEIEQKYIEETEGALPEISWVLDATTVEDKIWEVLKHHKKALHGKRQFLMEIELYLKKLIEKNEYISSKLAKHSIPHSELGPALGTTFAMMLNGPASNQLSSLITKNETQNITTDDIENTAMLSKGSLNVFFGNYNNLRSGLRISTQKLLDTLIIYLTKSNSIRKERDSLTTQVEIPLEEYFNLCGVAKSSASIKKARLKLNEDLRVLYSMSLEWREKKGSKTHDFDMMRICYRAAVRQSVIKVDFAPQWAEYLTSSYLTRYPLNILKLDERNPNSYHLARKMAVHYSISANVKKGTNNILSVPSLLEVCNDIPDIETVKAGSRKVHRDIILPFENALDSIPFINWEYCNSKGLPLKKNQENPRTYNVFSQLLVKFEIHKDSDLDQMLLENEQLRMVGLK